LPWTDWNFECAGGFAVRGGDPPKLLAAAIKVISTIDVARKSELAPLWVESLPLSVGPDSDRTALAIRP
jgi:hypothetical protein